MAKLKTGRHTSALKERRKAIKREEHNSSIKSSLRTVEKKVLAAVKIKDTAAAGELLKSAFSQCDKAVKKNIMHSNTAGNKKARLSRLVNSIAG